ncbi:MAG: hypothetical protein DRJ64_07570 [Thermoprotei archaeon]|nr:MAG: hypothetical protein DRJ64_07570 [Thermoprotei archaeon]
MNTNTIILICLCIGVGIIAVVGAWVCITLISLTRLLARITRHLLVVGTSATLPPATRARLLSEVLHDQPTKSGKNEVEQEKSEAQLAGSREEGGVIVEEGG